MNIHCYIHVEEFIYSLLKITMLCLVSQGLQGNRVGEVVRALAFHQCVPGSIPGPGVIFGLSLLVLYSAPRGFSPGTPVFPSPKKTTFDLIYLICVIYLI